MNRVIVCRVSATSYREPNSTPRNWYGISREGIRAEGNPMGVQDFDDRENK